MRKNPSPILLVFSLTACVTYTPIDVPAPLPPKVKCETATKTECPVLPSIAPLPPLAKTIRIDIAPGKPPIVDEGGEKLIRNYVRALHDLEAYNGYVFGPKPE